MCLRYSSSDDSTDTDVVRRLLIACLTVGLLGCEILSPQPDEGSVDLRVAPGFPAVPVPEHNPMTVAKVELGERLFFDPILSRDRTISCASCHEPDVAFADPRALSVGVDGRVGLRNSPSLVNVAYQRLFFWDGGSLSLEGQVLGPLEDENEMDANLGDILERLTTDASYRQQFEEVFDEPPSIPGLTQALAAFQRTLLSSGGPFDRFQQGDARALTPAQTRGLTLFDGKAGCRACHAGVRFTDDTFRNNGLAFANADSGRARITFLASDFGAFRVPSLRNVALTGPYMHDGRLATLADVVTHYNQGGTQSRNQDAAIRPLDLTPEEQDDLVAFLHALTDDHIQVGAP